MQSIELAKGGKRKSPKQPRLLLRQQVALCKLMVQLGEGFDTDGQTLGHNIAKDNPQFIEYGEVELVPT